MVSKLKTAADIYSQEGLVQLVHDTLGYTKRKMMGSPIIDPICYYLSVRELERRKKAESGIDDILATVGTNADGYTPPEQYRGYGLYKSLLTNHARDSIRGLAERVDEHRPRTVVEIGTLRGGSLYLWSRYFESANHLVSIDISDVPHKRLFDRFGNNNSIYFIQGNSHSEDVITRVHEAINHSVIDFLYIDGNHSYEGVRADFYSYLPLMAADGIIGFDDVSKEYPGVWKFWNEIKDEYSTEMFGEGNNVCAMIDLE